MRVLRCGDEQPCLGRWNFKQILVLAMTLSSTSTKTSPSPLGNTEMPYVFVGDDAFALRSFLVKLYPQKQLSLA